MLKLSVSGITCGGCAAAIERAVDATLPGAKIDVDLMTGIVVVGVETTQRAQVATAIEDAGFIITGDAA